MFSARSNLTRSSRSSCISCRVRNVVALVGAEREVADLLPFLAEPRVGSGARASLTPRQTVRASPMKSRYPAEFSPRSRVTDNADSPGLGRRRLGGGAGPLPGLEQLADAGSGQQEELPSSPCLRRISRPSRRSSAARTGSSPTCRRPARQWRSGRRHHEPTRTPRCWWSRGCRNRPLGTSTSSG